MIPCGRMIHPIKISTLKNSSIVGDAYGKEPKAD